MGRTAIVAVVVLCVLLGAAWTFQRCLVYLPSQGGVPPAAAVLPLAQDVILHTSDGLELGAWYVQAEEPSLDVAVLVAHGNAGDRAGRAPLAEALAARGLAVLLLDYRGYGSNPGSPSERGLALDVRAARQYLIEDVGVPANRILYFGESLGTAVVAELATEHPPAGLVLRSPFESLAALARVHYSVVPSSFLRDDLAVIEHVRRISVPTVVVYGTDDGIVPPNQSRAVARAAAQLHGEVEMPGADHNDAVLLDGDELIGAVVDLARQLRE